MPVQNCIVKVQKRNRALVKFDESRIWKAILRAAESVGGFRQDFLPGIHDKIFDAHGTDDQIAGFLADTVVICLNSDPHHHIANFPPTIEIIQDEVLHALRSYGFQNTADAYECYRWGRHWLREGALTADQFAGNGFPAERVRQTLAWNRQRGVDTVASLNETIRERPIQTRRRGVAGGVRKVARRSRRQSPVPAQLRPPSAHDVDQRTEFLRQDDDDRQAHRPAGAPGSAIPHVEPR